MSNKPKVVRKTSAEKSAKWRKEHPEDYKRNKTKARDGVIPNKTNMDKTLDAVNIADVKQKVSDVTVFGNGDLFQLIAKASSKEQGWMKSTKAMDTGVGVVIQVTTQQKNPDGSYSVAEALTFVPSVTIIEDANGNKAIGKLNL